MSGTYSYVTHHEDDVSIVHEDGVGFGVTLCGESTGWSTSFAWSFPDCQRCAVLAGVVDVVGASVKAVSA